jgi:hypothetical protein
MHPQMRQAGAGSCPICGMGLEPVTPNVETGTNPELRDMRRRFWVGAPLALVVLILAMSHDIPGLGAIANSPWAAWVELAVSTPVVLWCGWPFLVRGMRSLRRRQLNMFTLIARLATAPRQDHRVKPAWPIESPPGPGLTARNSGFSSLTYPHIIRPNPYGPRPPPAPAPAPNAERPRRPCGLPARRAHRLASRCGQSGRPLPWWWPVS